MMANEPPRQGPNDIANLPANCIFINDCLVTLFPIQPGSELTVFYGLSYKRNGYSLDNVSEGYATHTSPYHNYWEYNTTFPQGSNANHPQAYQHIFSLIETAQELCNDPLSTPKPTKSFTYAPHSQPPINHDLRDTLSFSSHHHHRQSTIDSFFPKAAPSSHNHHPYNNANPTIRDPDLQSNHQTDSFSALPPPFIRDFSGSLTGEHFLPSPHLSANQPSLIEPSWTLTPQINDILVYAGSTTYDYRPIPSPWLGLILNIPSINDTKGYTVHWLTPVTPNGRPNYSQTKSNTWAKSFLLGPRKGQPDVEYRPDAFIYFIPSSQCKPNHDIYHISPKIWSHIDRAWLTHTSFDINTSFQIPPTFPTLLTHSNAPPRLDTPSPLFPPSDTYIKYIYTHVHFIVRSSTCI